jgi:hypothetical protein
MRPLSGYSADERTVSSPDGSKLTCDGAVTRDPAEKSDAIHAAEHDKRTDAF